MDSKKEIWLMAKGNLALLQCQATVVGFLAAVVRKRLKLKLTSAKLDGSRVYRIAGGSGSKGKAGWSKRPSA